MNSPTTQCPHCGQRYALEAESAGRRLQCPSCHNEFEATPLPLAPSAAMNPPRTVQADPALRIAKYWPHALALAAGTLSLLMWAVLGFRPLGFLTFAFAAGIVVFGRYYPGKMEFFERLPSLWTMLGSAFAGGGVLAVLRIVARAFGRASRHNNDNVLLEVLFMFLGAAVILGGLALLLNLVKKIGPFRPAAVAFSIVAIGFPALWQVGAVMNQIGAARAEAMRRERLAEQERRQEEFARQWEKQRPKGDPVEEARLDRQSKELDEHMETLFNVNPTDKAAFKASFDNLKRILDDDDPPRLARLLTQGTKHERTFAVRKLRSVEPADSDDETKAAIRTELHRLMVGADQSFSLPAIQALGVWGNGDSDQQLIALLNGSADEKTIRYVYDALARRDSAAAAQAVVKRYLAGDKKQARAILRRMDAHVEDALLAEFERRGLGSDVIIVALFAQKGTAKSLPLLQNARVDATPSFQRALDGAIGKIQLRETD